MLVALQKTGRERSPVIISVSAEGRYWLLIVKENPRDHFRDSGRRNPDGVNY